MSIEVEKGTPEDVLVDYITKTPSGAIHEEAMKAACNEVLWAVGTGFAGSGAVGSDAIVDYIRRGDGHPECSVFGFPGKVSREMAGFANGTFAKAREYEDKYWFGGSRGSSVGGSVVPAALAAAEIVGNVDGRTLLAAVVLATDVQVRILRSLIGYTVYSGWSGSYVFAGFGAAIAASRLFQLSGDQTLSALGMAYSQAAGNLQGNVEGVMGVRVQMGFGVRNGLTAATLAQLGVTGSHQFLTGEYGLYNLIFSDLQVDLDALIGGLGQQFYSQRLGYKAYPCGAVAHTTLDAVGSIMKQGGLASSEVDAIRVRATPDVRLMTHPEEKRRHPRDHVEAQFSLPWAVACLVLDGDLSLKHYSDAWVNMPEYQEMAGRVSVELDPSMDGAEVTIELKDGRVERSPRMVIPRGHPDNPLSDEEFISRFDDCLQNGRVELPADSRRRALDLIVGLSETKDVSELMTILRG